MVCDGVTLTTMVTKGFHLYRIRLETREIIAKKAVLFLTEGSNGTPKRQE